MSFPSLPYGKMVTILHRKLSGTDEFGNDVYTSTPEQVGPCAVQQGSSRENIAFNDQVITNLIAFLPYGTTVGYLDAIVVDGVQYEIDGDPDVWVSPFSGHTAPVRVEARIVKGASALWLRLYPATTLTTRASAGSSGPRICRIWFVA